MRGWMGVVVAGLWSAAAASLAGGCNPNRRFDVREPDRVSYSGARAERVEPESPRTPPDADERGAKEVVLVFSPSDSPSVKGYKLYAGTQPGFYNLVKKRDLGMPPRKGGELRVTFKLADPSGPVEWNGRLYFAVTAYDEAGNESEPSREAAVDF